MGTFGIMVIIETIFFFNTLTQIFITTGALPQVKLNSPLLLLILAHSLTVLMLHDCY